MRRFGKIRGLFAALLVSGLMPNHALADLRFGCMAEDEHVKLAIRVEFSTGLGGRVSHLTGRLMLLAPDAPKALQKLSLDHSMITQIWSDRDNLMMRFHNEAVAGGPVLIRIATKVEDGEKGPLVGTYRIDQPRMNGPALTYSGRAICQNSKTGDSAGN